MRSQGSPGSLQGQIGGERLYLNAVNRREASAHLNSESNTEDNTSESSVVSSNDDVMPSNTQVTPRPPLVKQYYNKELKKWLPISISPDTARRAVLGEEEGGDGQGWHSSGEHNIEGDKGQKVEGEFRFPKAWDTGDRDCVAGSTDLIPDHQEFLLAGHINLNKSPSAAAMFAKHQSEEAAKFKLDKKGNIISRVKTYKNPKREGKPLSVTEWKEKFKKKTVMREEKKSWADRPSQSTHTMRTRLGKKREE